MSEARDIKELIQAMAAEGDSVSEGLFFVADVVSATDESCTIDIDGLELSDVRTGAVIDSNTKNLRIKPKVGSKVLVCDMSGNFTQLFVVAFSEVDTITINGGSLGGLVNIEKLKENLNSIKTYCNAMKTAVSAGLTSVGVGSAASGTAGATAFNEAMASQSITIAEMEDTKIKH